MPTGLINRAESTKPSQNNTEPGFSHPVKLSRLLLFIVTLPSLTGCLSSIQSGSAIDSSNPQVPTTEGQPNVETAALQSETELQSMPLEQLAAYYSTLLISAHPDETYIQLVEKILAPKLLEASSVPVAEGAVDEAVADLSSWRRQLEADLQLMRSVGDSIRAASIAPSNLNSAELLYDQYHVQMEFQRSHAEAVLTLEQLKALAARDYLLEMLARELENNPSLENDPYFAEVLASSRTDLSFSNPQSWENYYHLLDVYLQQMVLPVLRLVYPQSSYPDYFEASSSDRFWFIEHHLVESWARAKIDERDRSLLPDYQSQDSARIVVTQFLFSFAQENGLPYPEDVEAFLFQVIEQILPPRIKLTGTNQLRFSFAPPSDGRPPLNPPNFQAELTFPLGSGQAKTWWTNGMAFSEKTQNMYVFTGDPSQPLMRVYGFPMTALDAGQFPSSGFAVYWYEGDELNKHLERKELLPGDGQIRPSQIILVPAQFLSQDGGYTYSYGSEDEWTITSKLATILGVEPNKLHRMILTRGEVDGDRGGRVTKFQILQGYVLLTHITVEGDVLLVHISQPDGQHYSVFDTGVRELAAPNDVRDASSIVSSLLALYLGDFEIPPGLFAALMRASETTATRNIIVPKSGTRARIFCEIRRNDGSIDSLRPIQALTEVGWTSAPIIAEQSDVWPWTGVPDRETMQGAGKEETIYLHRIIEQKFDDGTVIRYYIDAGQAEVYPTERTIKDGVKDYLLALVNLFSHNTIANGPAGGPLLMLYYQLLKFVFDRTYSIG